jgi:hypothetical protein
MKKSETRASKRTDFGYVLLLIIQKSKHNLNTKNTVQYLLSQLEFDILLTTMISFHYLIIAHLVSLVMSQYINHHQQVYTIGFNNGNRIKEFDTKALTPVNQKGSKKLHWAFASSVSNEANDDGKLRTLLVKLKSNTPDTAPFAFQWAKAYGRSDILLDVEDVVHETKGGRGYILAGKVKGLGFGSDQWRAFLLRTDDDGEITAGPKFYQNTYSFKSVVPTHEGKGYIAVGQSSEFRVDNPDTNAGRGAVYVSVNKNLDVRCSRETNGSFTQNNQKLPVESGWNKVIQYSKKVDGGKGYAMVGESILDYRNKCEKDKNYNVLVATLNDKCSVKFEYMYGDKNRRVEERGLSIANISNKGDLAITGNAKRWKKCGTNSEIVFDDILVFALKKKGNVKWWRYYDVQSKVSNKTYDLVYFLIFLPAL